MKAAEIEAVVVNKLWTDTLDRLTPEQREILMAKVRSLTEQFGPSAGKEIAGFAGLGAAQMSGFGVYLLGSTLLGAINSFLGLGLGFGAFTGLSSLISLAIGPLGWAALGLYTIRKLGAPNYKKLLPVVILIAVERAGVAAPVNLLIPTPEVSTRLGLELRKPTLPVRGFSKAERTNFELRSENRACCELAAKLCPGLHFLDLSPEDQRAIRDLRAETIESEKESDRIIVHAPRIAVHVAQIDPKKSRKERKRTEREHFAEKKRQRKLKAAIHKCGKSYLELFPNLEFELAAVERLEFLERKGASSQIDEKLGKMNAGHIVFHRSITRTKPKIYEEKAGWDYRIYFRPKGPNTYIRLVGDKDTQDADFEQLRR